MSNKNNYLKYKTRGSDFHYRQIDKFNFKEFNAYMYSRYIKAVDMVVQYIKKNCSAKSSININILDLGCGDGVMLYLLAKRLKDYNIKLFGVDISEEAIEIASKKIEKGNFYFSNICSTKFNKNKFDIIIALDVIEHINNPEAMLFEIKRIAKDKSFVIIGTPIRIRKKPIDKAHVQEFFPEDLRNIFTKIFKTCRIIETHNLLFLLLYIKRIVFLKKEYLLFRHLINFFVIVLSINPFLREKKYKNQLFSYMYIYVKINKKNAI